MVAVELSYDFSPWVALIVSERDRASREPAQIERGEHFSMSMNALLDEQIDDPNIDFVRREAGVAFLTLVGEYLEGFDKEWLASLRPAARELLDRKRQTLLEMLPEYVGFLRNIRETFDALETIPAWERERERDRLAASPLFRFDEELTVERMANVTCMQLMLFAIFRAIERGVERKKLADLLGAAFVASSWSHGTLNGMHIRVPDYSTGEERVREFNESLERLHALLTEEDLDDLDRIIAQRRAG